MAKILFPTFLEDSREYRKLQAYWQTQWQSVMRWVSKGQGWKTPWLNTKAVDGTELMDGDPIFSAWCEERKLAVRVVQLPPAFSPPGLQPKIASFDPDYDRIKVLELFCVLSQEVGNQAAELMSGFVETGEIGWGRERDGVARSGYPSAGYTAPRILTRNRERLTA